MACYAFAQVFVSRSAILARVSFYVMLCPSSILSLWLVVALFTDSVLILLTQEYKLVQIAYGNGNFCRCMVYTLGTIPWRNITDASNLSNCINHNVLKGNYSLGGNAKSYRALYSNGALHWFFSPANVILSFDLLNEKFSWKRSPIPETSATSWPRYLVEWQGSLCVALHNVSKLTIYIYQYKQCGNKFYWTRRTILFPYKPDSGIGFLDGDSSLFYWYNGAFLSWYKPKDDFGYNNPTETMEWFTSLPGVDYNRMTGCEFIPSVENLVSLKTLLRIKSVTSL